MFKKVETLLTMSLWMSNSRSHPSDSLSSLLHLDHILNKDKWLLLESSQFCSSVSMKRLSPSAVPANIILSWDILRELDFDLDDLDVSFTAGDVQRRVVIVVLTCCDCCPSIDQKLHAMQQLTHYQKRVTYWN